MTRMVVTMVTPTMLMLIAAPISDLAAALRAGTGTLLAAFR